MAAAPYDERFYRTIEAGSSSSAEVVVPITLRLVPAASVCDLGCGTGSWLRAFQVNGVKEIVGIDGDYVDRQMLKIPVECFIPHDLTKPFSSNRKFDLAVSLEVAEHLPESCAESFVETLTKLAPVVLFSAAIPLQGGRQHLNEQWQDYWTELFRMRGYVAIDCIRPEVWSDERVEWWYRQNTLVYCNDIALERYATLAAFGTATLISLAHPICYRNLQAEFSVATNPSLSEAIKALPVLAKRAIMRRLKSTPR